VVNFDTVKVTAVAPLKVPVRSFTVSTRADIATLHVAEEGAVTVQTLVESIAVPAPTNVIITPALVPAVMAVVGVKEIVAVVAAFFAAEVRVIVGPAVMPPMIAANVPLVPVSDMVGVAMSPAAHPIARVLEAACMAGVVIFVKVKVMTPFAA